VTFSSQEPGSQLALVALDAPEAGGTALSNPVTVDSARLEGRALRISSSGKAPVYWLIPEDSGRRLDIRMRSLPSCAQGEQNRNRPTRLVLKAYQALSAKEFNLARELATKASEVDPSIAAPFIIVGLAYLQEGRREQARVAFNKARALDPEDQDLLELLRLAQ